MLALDVEKGIVTAEAGVSLDTLMRVLLPLGWFPMVMPGTSFVTIGGAIASDIHGKFRHGSFADYVDRMQIVTPAQGVTTLDPNAMLVGCVAINSSSTGVTIAGPSGMSEAWDIGGKRNEVDDALQATAGQSGAKTWTLSSGRAFAGWLAALRPA